MTEFLTTSTFFRVFLSLITYHIGIFVRKKTGLTFLTPLVTATAIVIVVLVLTGIDYETYKASTSVLTYFLTPATVCLAIPLYQKLEILKKNFVAVILGILSGVLVSALTILGFCILFNFDDIAYVSLLPK